MPGIVTTEEETHGWIKFSENKLISLERQIFQVLKTAYKGWHVLIDHKPTIKAKIWTIALNTQSKNTPLVLLHGFGAGVGFWCLNFDHLAANRPVYAIDLLGFGRSSRPDFSNDPLEAEMEIVESIEKWRKEVKLEKFILLGHSFGGYLATSYSILYPNQVKHLILADPWGFAEKPANYNPPLHWRTLSIVLYPFTVFNPLATVRAAGPLGPWIVKKLRADISYKFAGRLENHEIILDYIYQCNCQKPTGESAFQQMKKGLGWAKNPMLNRIHELNHSIPITVLNGSDTWMDKTVGEKIKAMRMDSYVGIEVIDQAGHHIQVDNPESFNEIVDEVCKFVDKENNNMIINNMQSSDKDNVHNGIELVPEPK